MADPQESVEIEKTAGGGLRARLSGQNIFAMMIAAALGAGAWVLIDHRQESKAAIGNLEKSQEKALGSVAEALAKNAEEQAVMNYILTLDQAERQKLRLDMPESLRRRVR